MIDLFKNYSGAEIVVFTIILALGIKNLILFYDWAKSRTKQAIEKDDKPDKLQEIVNNQQAEMG